MNRSALHHLILELFEGTWQFRNFLLYEDRAPNLVHALPDVSVAAESFVSDAITALAVRGLIDGEFFRRLALERPNRVDAIARTASLWSISLAPAPQPPAPSPTPSNNQANPPPTPPIRVLPREAVELEDYGVRSTDAGRLALTLRDGPRADDQAITLSSTIGHIQRLPSAGRGGRCVSVPLREALGADCNFSWAEYDIRVSAGEARIWSVRIQSRRNRFGRQFNILCQSTHEQEERT